MAFVVYVHPEESIDSRACEPLCPRVAIHPEQDALVVALPPKPRD